MEFTMESMYNAGGKQIEELCNAIGIQKDYVKNITINIPAEGCVMANILVYVSIDVMSEVTKIISKE